MSGRLASADIWSEIQRRFPADDDVLTRGLRDAVQELNSRNLNELRGPENEIDQVVEKYLEKIWEEKLLRSMSHSTYNK